MRTVSRLTDNERLFLSSCALQADASVKELATLTGLRQHSVRRIQDSLLERGLIVPVYHIDFFALGYLDFTALFNRGAESSTSQRKLDREVLDHPNILGFSRMGGGYRYMIWFVVKQLFEVEEVLATLRPTEPGATLEKILRTSLDWTVLNPQYLSASHTKRRMIALSSKTEVVTPSSSDLELLRALTRSPGESLRSIAQTVGMSPTSFQYRIDRLREMKVIRGVTYVLQCDKLGIQTYRVLITEAGLTVEQRARLRKVCEQCPNVVAIISCVGSWDYELRFETENSEELDAFCQSLYDSFSSGLHSITTLQQFKVLKRIGFPLD